MSGRGYHCYKSFSAYRLEVVQKPLHQRLVVLLSNRLAISGTVIAGSLHISFFLFSCPLSISVFSCPLSFSVFS